MRTDLGLFARRMHRCCVRFVSMMFPAWIVSVTHETDDNGRASTIYRWMLWVLASLASNLPRNEKFIIETAVADRWTGGSVSLRYKFKCKNWLKAVRL
jgi:hypothetical protein